MPSDNDDGSASSSGSGCASPAPKRAAAATVATMAAAGKGILVHNNRRSVNTNRVSFMAPGPSSTTSTSSRSPTSSAPSTPSPPVKRPKHRGGQRPKSQQQQQQHRRHSDAVAVAANASQLPYHMRTGRRLTGFGIKSYLHEFYDEPDDRRELFQDENDDDFKYSVEPTEIRWRRHCGGVYAALGLAVTAVGLMAMAAGHWIPVKEPFVGHTAGVEVIDRGAVEFNELLASCRYVGSAMFAAGVVFSVVRFWLSVIRGDRAADDGKLASAADDAKLAAAIGDRLRREHADRRRSSLHHSLQQPLSDRHTTVRIPVTGSVENVQPDPRAIHLRFDRDS